MGTMNDCVTPRNRSLRAENREWDKQWPPRGPQRLDSCVSFVAWLGVAPLASLHARACVPRVSSELACVCVAADEARIVENV